MSASSASRDVADEAAPTRALLVRLAVVLAAVLMAVGAATPRPAAADPSSDKARVDAELAQLQASLESATERAQIAAIAYQTATLALPGAQSALAEARGRVLAAEVAQREAQRRLAAATEAFQAASSSYDEAVARVDAARERVSSLVAATYKGTALLQISAFLSAGSPSELSERMGLLDHLAADEKRALDTVTVARQEAREKQGVAELARQVADEADRRAAQAVAEARDAESAAAEAAAAVQRLADQAAQAKTDADSERGAVLAQYAQMKAESDRIAELLRAPAGGGSPNRGPPPSGGAFFLMPTAGYKSSDFGMRYDPYYQVWQLHAGVDIAAPGGQAILAGADGRVASAGWVGGYGNYTCISHGTYNGQNLATCYAHQSQILVGVGQNVSRGEVIGRVGTTGASTGNHLHFEVRLNGTPVQPLGWLPACLC